jgi:hypothetical protein
MKWNLFRKSFHTLILNIHFIFLEVLYFKKDYKCGSCGLFLTYEKNKKEEIVFGKI